MTLVPLTDCCLLLGVDPKTLRLWLKAAQLGFTPHPTDARLKCLTASQLHHLAALHGRFLPHPLPGEGSRFPASSALPAAVLSPEQPAPSTASPSTLETDMRQQMQLLQAQVTTLQQQVTELALALLRERLPLSTHQIPPPPSPNASPAQRLPPVPCPSLKADRPAARSRALPLIEYGADGHYLILSPTQGVLSLVPDSPEWFAWLASLTSFTFRGRHGHFSADRRQRDGHLIQCWGARRSHHGRSCHLYVGATEHVTLARLEDMAAMMEKRLTRS